MFLVLVGILSSCGFQKQETKQEQTNTGSSEAEITPEESEMVDEILNDVFSDIVTTGTGEEEKATSESLQKDTSYSSPDTSNTTSYPARTQTGAS